MKKTTETLLVDREFLTKVLEEQKEIRATVFILKESVRRVQELISRTSDHPPQEPTPTSFFHFDMTLKDTNLLKSFQGELMGLLDKYNVRKLNGVYISQRKDNG